MKLVAKPSPILAASTPESDAALSDAQLSEWDQTGPQYTSYPTADRFVEAFGPAQYRQALRQRAQGAVVGGAPPLALCVQVPSCEGMVRYGVCVCGSERDRDRIIAKPHSVGRDYLGWLALELELHRAEFGATQVISQLHLGGGCPAFLDDDTVRDLMSLLGGAFKLLPTAERSIEVDPRSASPQRLRHFAALGFNRVTFAVQDFDPAVQAALRCVQTSESVIDLVAEARALRFESITVDLVYGLPRQTPESFKRMIVQVAAMRPPRITLRACAQLPLHGPRRAPPLARQRLRCEPPTMPTAEHRVQMQRDAVAGFTERGYVYIGMDQFALPSDMLAVAKRQGRLHRSLRGYTTQPDCDRIALGVSAVSRVGATYSQNAKTLPEYRDALTRGDFSVAQGLALSRDDLLRRTVIMALVCQGRVEFESIELAHLVRVQEVFVNELAQLREFEAQGLVHVNEQEIQVTEKGWLRVRAIAMVFDRHLQSDIARERFSRII